MQSGLNQMSMPRPLSILQITDMHIMPNPGEKLMGVDTEHYFQTVLEHAYSHRDSFDLILITGDIAQYPTDASYQRILKRLKRYGTECICLPGNHDDFAMMQRILNEGNVSCRKHWVYGNWQLICLNSQIPGQAGGYLAEDELEFLEACLINDPDRFAVIAVHHHCIPTESAWMDTMIIQNHGSLFKLLAHYPKVRMIATGHIHQLMDLKLQSIRVLGTPSTCFQFKPKSRNFSLDKLMPGYRLIELDNEGGMETRLVFLPDQITGLDPNSPGY